jgi:hypothetical protein
MKASMAVDWAGETATWEWGRGEYRLVAHRREGARTVYEYRTPEGEIVPVGGFRMGLWALWWRMLRECD